MMVSQNGSHLKLKKNGTMTIVPVHKGKDIPLGTLRQIQKQTGVKLL
jgi:predicted RNA binding protein YcfA (HicA-like mRNA interferase family)